MTVLTTMKRIWDEAKKTLTAWLAMGVTGLAAAAENVESIYAQVPSLEPYLPQSHYVHTGIHYAMAGLGIAVAVARVRRLVWPPKAP